MKRFLTRVLVFGLVGSGILVASSLANGAMAAWDRLEIDPSVRTLILGDSHVQTALDPGLIPESIHLGSSAEPYVATYYKLLDILENNPHIDKVVLGFSWHNLSTFNDTKFISPTYSRTLFDRYVRVLRYRDLGGLEIDVRAYAGSYLRHRVLLSPNRLWNVLASLSGRPDRRRYRHVGGYLDKSGSDLDDTSLARVALDRHYPVGGGATSAMAIGHLERISRLCAERGLTLYLFNPPVHPVYSAGIPSVHREAFAAESVKMRRRPHVRVLDYGDFDLPEDHFLDYDHLNRRGAEVMSPMLAEVLESDSGRGSAAGF